MNFGPMGSRAHRAIACSQAYSCRGEHAASARLTRACPVPSGTGRGGTVQAIPIGQGLFLAHGRFVSPMGFVAKSKIPPSGTRFGEPTTERFHAQSRLACDSAPMTQMTDAMPARQSAPETSRLLPIIIETPLTQGRFY
jgi:hypothetical protein